MQQRRFRPGDVVDDYCPRERRITDHAVVAMIDDNIRQTRCVVCDAEHEYKDGKVPARRKKPQAALFTQVLEGLQGPPSARLAQPDADLELVPLTDAAIAALPVMPAQAHPPTEFASGNGHSSTHSVDDLMATAEPDVNEPTFDADESAPARDEGPVRRSLIRATLPRPEGQPPPARVLPDFTIRQPGNGRGGRPGGRRRGGHQPQGQGNAGPMRFGRGGQGQGQGPRHDHGQSHGPRPHGGRNHGPRRGGKKR